MPYSRLDQPGSVKSLVCVSPIGSSIHLDDTMADEINEANKGKFLPRECLIFWTSSPTEKWAHNSRTLYPTRLTKLVLRLVSACYRLTSHLTLINVGFLDTDFYYLNRPSHTTCNTRSRKLLGPTLERFTSSMRMKSESFIASFDSSLWRSTLRKRIGVWCFMMGR